ncbi:MAG: thiaminase II [Nitrososphaerota archaeon]|nr:thiaminase II [Candidatus Calditenuaceae archaeon]MDW8073692.1 thiaminase II [Nitrososphaerota archaeon]
MPGFTRRLWLAVSDVYDAILRHPFITGLKDGSLNMETFKEYIIQDALYLSRFSRAVAAVGVKAPDDDSALTLISAARDALSVERASLHDFLLSEWGIESRDLEKVQISPVNQAYTDFLIASVHERSFLTGLASVLPCFWVYLEVGKRLLEKGSPVETYSRWISTYSSLDYEQAVKKIIALTDSHAERACEPELEEASLYFRLSTIYEYLFWDSIYRGVNWPFRLRQ